MHKPRAVLLVGVLAVVAFALYKAKGDLMDFLGIAKEAGKKYNLDPLLILAIAKAESGLKVSAINRNNNGTYDYGLMQVNSINLDFVGATKDTIFNPATNIHAGAKVLDQKRTYIQQKKGTFTTQELISAYNQGEGRLVRSGILNAAYVAKVWLWYGIYRLRGGI